MRLNSAIQTWMTNSVSTLTSGFQGMLSSGRQHQQASQDILQQTIHDMDQQSNGVTVRISDAYHERRQDDVNVSSTRTFEDSIVSLNEAGVTYSASARLVKAHSSLLDSLFDAIA